MRILIMTGLLIAGLMLSNSNHAQTWDAPLPLASGVSTFNSCAMPVQTLLMDNGAVTITAPAG